jgi:hypothetical protein
MKKIFLIILFFSCLYLGCDFFKDHTVTPTQAQSFTENDLSKLSLEFKRLQNIPGHFKGGPWNDEVDAWMGAKHRIMIALGSQISQAHSTVSDLKQLMGEPDRIIMQTDPRFAQMNQWTFEEIATASQPDMYFLYDWRGDHDVLIFACQKNNVIFSKWYYAGE